MTDTRPPTEHRAVARNVDRNLRPARSRGGPAAAGPALCEGGPDPVRVPVLLLVPAGADPRSRWCSPSSRTTSPRAPTGVTARLATGRRADERRQHSCVQRLPLLLPAGHGPRLRGGPLAPREGPGQPRRVGPRRPRLRHVHRLVPDRRRPLHGVHLRGRARPAVRRQRDRLLRGAVHDRGLPADLPVPAAAVVGVPPARLRDACRLRGGPLRQPSPRPGGRAHRHPRDDALHRAAAGRHRGRARGDGLRRRRGQLGRRARRRCSSRSGCSPPTPTRPACARRR